MTLEQQREPWLELLEASRKKQPSAQAAASTEGNIPETGASTIDTQKTLRIQALTEYIRQHALKYSKKNKEAYLKEYGLSTEEFDRIATDALLGEIKKPAIRALQAIENLNALDLGHVLKTPHSQSKVTGVIRDSLDESLWLDILIDYVPYLEKDFVTSPEFHDKISSEMHNDLWSRYDFPRDKESVWNDENQQYNFRHSVGRQAENDRDLAAKVIDTRGRIITPEQRALFRQEAIQALGLAVFTRRLRQRHLITALELGSCFELTPAQMKITAYEVAKRLLTDPESLYSNGLQRNISDALDILVSFGYTVAELNTPEWQSVARLALARIRLEEIRMKDEMTYESHQSFVERTEKEFTAPPEWDDDSIDTQQEKSTAEENISLASQVRNLFHVSPDMQANDDWNTTIADTVRMISLSGYRGFMFFNDSKRFTQAFGEEIMQTPAVRAAVAEILLHPNCRGIFGDYPEAIVRLIQYFNVEKEVQDPQINGPLTELALELVSFGHWKGMKELLSILSPPSFWVKQAVERGLPQALIANPAEAQAWASSLDFSEHEIRTIVKTTVLKTLYAPMGGPKAAEIAEQCHLSTDDLNDVVAQIEPSNQRSKASAQLSTWDKTIEKGALLWLHLWPQLRQMPEKHAHLIELSALDATPLPFDQRYARSIYIAKFLMNESVSDLFMDATDIHLLHDLWATQKNDPAYNVDQLIHQGLWPAAGPATLLRPLSKNPHLRDFAAAYPLTFNLYANYVTLMGNASLTDTERNDQMKALVDNNSPSRLNQLAQSDEDEDDAENPLARFKDYITSGPYGDEGITYWCEHVAHYAKQARIPHRDIVRLAAQKIDELLNEASFETTGFSLHVEAAAELTKILKLDTKPLLAYATSVIPSLIQEENFHAAYRVREIFTNLFDEDAENFLEKLGLRASIEAHWLQAVQDGRMKIVTDMLGFVDGELSSRPEVQEQIVAWASAEVGRDESVPHVLVSLNIPPALLQDPKIQESAKQAMVDLLTGSHLYRAEAIARSFGVSKTIWKRPDVQQLLEAAFISAVQRREDLWLHPTGDALIKLVANHHLPDSFLQSDTFMRATADILGWILYPEIDVNEEAEDTYEDDDNQKKYVAYVNQSGVENILTRIPLEQTRLIDIGTTAALKHLAHLQPAMASKVLKLLHLPDDTLHTPNAQAMVREIATRSLVEGKFIQVDTIDQSLLLVGLDDSLYRTPEVRTAIREHIVNYCQLPRDKNQGTFLENNICYKPEFTVIDRCNLKEDIRNAILQQSETIFPHRSAIEIYTLYQTFDLPKAVVIEALLLDVPDTLRPYIPDQLTLIFDAADTNVSNFYRLYKMLLLIARDCPWLIKHGFEPVIRISGENASQSIGWLYQLYWDGAFATEEDAHHFAEWVDQRQIPTSQFISMLCEALKNNVLVRPLSRNAWVEEYLKQCDPNPYTLTAYATIMHDSNLSPEERQRRIQDLTRQYPKAPETPDPYLVLGVDPSASEATITAQYRQLVKQHHPDMGGDNEKFLQIKEAYQTIMPERKKRAKKEKENQSKRPKTLPSPKEK